MSIQITKFDYPAIDRYHYSVRAAGESANRSRFDCKSLIAFDGAFDFGVESIGRINGGGGGNQCIGHMFF